MQIKNRGQDIFHFRYDDFTLLNYDPHPALKMEIAVLSAHDGSHPGGAWLQQCTGAVMHFGDDIDLCTCADFTQLFQAVRQGRADYAMAPVENSLAGSIHEVWELLFSHAPHVVGEYYLPR